MLGIAGHQHVADVEIHLDVVGADLVDKIARLQRGEQEFVPDVLQRNDHAGLLGVLGQLFAGLERAVIGHVVRHDRAIRNEIRAHAAGHDQYRAAAQHLGGMKLEAHGGLGLLADGGIVVRQGRAPVKTAGQRADLDPQLVRQRAETGDLFVAAFQAQRALGVQRQLDAVIAGPGGQAHTILGGHTGGKRPDINALFHESVSSFERLLTPWLYYSRPRRALREQFGRLFYHFGRFLLAFFSAVVYNERR